MNSSWSLSSQLPAASHSHHTSPATVQSIDRQQAVCRYLIISLFCYTTSVPWNVTLSWLQNASIFTLTFQRAILTGKVGHTDLVSGVRFGFISWITSLCAHRLRFVLLCNTQTNRHIHTQTLNCDQLIWKFSGWAKVTLAYLESRTNRNEFFDVIKGFYPTSIKK